MKKLILLIVLLIALAGCEVENGEYGGSSNKTPDVLQTATKPITVRANNENGVVLQDAEGIIYTYHSGYYIARIIGESELKPGDVFAK